MSKSGLGIPDNSYDALKKLFPSVPLDPTYLATQEHAEHGALLPTSRAGSSKWATPEQFRAALDREKGKVIAFYTSKLEELGTSDDLIEGEVHSIEVRELHGAEDEVIREEEEDEDYEPSEGDILLGRTPTSPHRTPQRKRSSFFGRLPGMPKIGQGVVSGDAADIMESTLPATIRTPGSRQRSRSIPYPLGTEEGSAPVSPKTPRPRRTRALSDLSSADDAHDRRTSISSVSTGLGASWMRSSIRAHKLGLQVIHPSQYPDWLKEEVTRDEEEGSSKPAFYNWTGNSDYATVLRIGMKKRIAALWLDLYALKQYVDLNFTAFEKILKKYDKNTNSKLKKQYVSENVLTSFPWTDEGKAELDRLLNKVLFLYRRVVCAGDEELAKEQLRAQLRERIVVDRETVWSQMVSDRRGQGIFRSVEPDEQLPAFERPKRGLRTPCGRVGYPRWFSQRGFIFLIALASMAAIIAVNPLGRIEESNCLAMLVFCTILWATEAIPLFVTSLAVPFLAVVLRVLRSDDEEDRRLSASEGTK